MTGTVVAMHCDRSGGYVNHVSVRTRYSGVDTIEAVFVVGLWKFFVMIVILVDGSCPGRLYGSDAGRHQVPSTCCV